jgi:hypothetical protein
MLVIDDPALIQRLEALAQDKGQSVEDVLTNLVAETEPDDHQEYGITGEALLEIIDKFAFSGDHPIDATQADDILNAEFADYLLKRMEDGASSTTDR